jgi:N-methylhydantoinase A
VTDRRAGASTRVAVDIGGTFTDLIAVDTAGRVVRAKADSTPDALEDGVLTVLQQSGLEPPSVDAFVHGSTVVINAITERHGARTALVTTRGFRDVLQIARGNRPDLYNARYQKPRPFVDRELRFEVTERISYRGEILTPLDESEVPDLARSLRSAEVEAVAVAFLHSWIEPVHEVIVADRLRELLPGVSVVASHEISRQWREYERTNTTVLSAYVQPVVAAYLEALRKGLSDARVAASLYAMQSSGGVCSFDRAVRTPVTMLESGPVAGVTAAAELGRRLGASHVITLDVGGTTAKTSAIRDGRVRINSLHHVERDPAHAGYPLQVPVVDIVEIGAGGGSIAWVDDAGGLHVGPRSAGAQPGPACYGRGGVEPTVTDANLVAGRLDPDYFLGGRLPLDVAAARAAVESLGRRLGVDAQEAARGILRMAVAQMANALRLVTLRRGHDPRDFTFVAFGGNGPLHAALLARELGIRQTLVPPGPGHFSAFGMLAGGLAGHAVRTQVGRLDDMDVPGLLQRVEVAAWAELGPTQDDVVIERFLELRYRGQEHTLEVKVPDVEAWALGDALRTEFDRRSFEAYALVLELPLEVVAARVVAMVPSSDVSMVIGADDEAHLVKEGARRVDFDVYGDVQDATIVNRRHVGGEPILGPCIVEEPASTTLVLPGQSVWSDNFGNLIVEECDD